MTEREALEAEMARFGDGQMLPIQWVKGFERGWFGRKKYEAALAAREEPQKSQVQVIVDFLDAWRYCPVASADSPSYECLEKAAKEILTALAAAREDAEPTSETDALGPVASAAEDGMGLEGYR